MKDKNSLSQNVDNNDNSSRPLRVLISGGGTGGHIFPALSIAEEMKNRLGADILFVGAENRMEMTRVPEAGYDIIGLPVAGFYRKQIWKNVSVLMKLFKSMRRAKKIVRSFTPDIAVGVGGYASGPTLKAAQRAGIPTLIQEQNSYAGVTNKMLAKKAKKICVAYSGMDRFFPKETITLTGNPIRRALLECNVTPQEARKAFGLDADKKTLLVVGGSLGALTVNESMKSGVKKLIDKGYQVIWQTGKNYGDKATRAVEGLHSVVATPFITDMGKAYRAADLIISRAGAGSISELQALGKPVILVPSPNVAEDHQTHNALALSSVGAAVLVPDSEAREKLVDTAINLLADDEKLEEMSSNIAKMGIKDSASRICDEICHIVENTNHH